ncbi:MAG TPA: ATP-binding cassette domain-containing protein [Terriglobales bacterium]|nr:ATP-binding cassette domain-containing protein [Terriglobales bacterium]
MNAPAHALLEMRNVQVVRGNKTVLHDFNLRIKAGEHVAILGPNGCGKSTLIKTITRELYPVARPESSITILGESTWNVFDLRSRLGIVSNDLMAWCTGEALGRDIVISGFFASNDVYPNHLVTTEYVEKAEAVLSLLQVLHLADRPVSTMSSGEARRVLIARALVHQPKALLFDEPSNSLDLFARRALHQTMSDLARSGIGIVLVTHDPADVIPEIERIVVMNNGRVFADGRKEEVLRPELLSKTFGVEVEIARRNGHYYFW